MRSSNRACFRSGARRLSPELSFCSRCPWLFPSPSAFGFPPAREEEKSSKRRGVTKWILLSSSSSACLPGMLVPRGMLGGADHILGFNDVFSIFPYFREDLDQEEKARFGELCSSENGKGREWFARYVSAQVSGVVGKQQESCTGFGTASGQGDLFISQRSIFGRQELKETEEPQQREIQQQINAS